MGTRAKSFVSFDPGYRLLPAWSFRRNRQENAGSSLCLSSFFLLLKVWPELKSRAERQGLPSRRILRLPELPSRFAAPAPGSSRSASWFVQVAVDDQRRLQQAVHRIDA